MRWRNIRYRTYALYDTLDDAREAQREYHGTSARIIRFTDTGEYSVVPSWMETPKEAEEVSG